MSHLRSISKHLYLCSSPNANAAFPNVRAPWRVGRYGDELYNPNLMETQRSKPIPNTGSNGDRGQPLAAGRTHQTQHQQTTTPLGPTAKGQPATVRGPGTTEPVPGCSHKGGQATNDARQVPRDDFDLSWQTVKYRGKSGKQTPGKKAVPSQETGKEVARHKPNKPSKKQRRKTRLQKAASLGNINKQPQAQTRTGSAPPPVAVGKTATAEPNDRRRSEGLSRKARATQKRARMNETVSPRGEHKKLRLEHSRPQPASFADAAGADLVVAITTETTGHLSPPSAELIQKALLQRIIAQAMEPATTGEAGPSFRGKPIVADGVLKVWCEDQRTLAWLKEAVSNIQPPTKEKLVVKRQIDIQKRVCCGLLVPGTWESASVIGRTLRYQNPWAKVDQWLFHNLVERTDTFVVVSVPETIAKELHAHGRRLACGLGSVYVKFRDEKGKYGVELPPGPQPGDVAVAGSSATPSTGQTPVPATPSSFAGGEGTVPPAASSQDPGGPDTSSLGGESGKDWMDRMSDLDLDKELEAGAANISDVKPFSDLN